MRKGKFVTVEGCEGAGKSTQIRLLCDRLGEAGVDFVSTREPGGSKVAEDIRKIILSQDSRGMTDECEALLYAAARAQHLRDVVGPALDAGKLVICDRYVDSSLAYQGHARGLGLDYVRAINSSAMERYEPDLTVFLDISPDEAFERKHGADKGDRMETEGLAFHRKVYEGYRELLALYPGRIVAVDCRGSRDETAEKVFAALKSRGVI